MPGTFRLHPDAAAVNFHDPLYQGQADARPFRLAIKLFEQVESLFLMPRINSDAVVPDIEDDLVTALLRSDLYERLWLIPHELDGIVDQVLENLDQARSISPEPNRCFRDFNLNSFFDNPSCNKSQCLLDDFL